MYVSAYKDEHGGVSDKEIVSFRHMYIYTPTQHMYVCTYQHEYEHSGVRVLRRITGFNLCHALIRY